MGHSHEHRPYVSRRQFLKRAAIAGGALSAGPYFWRQLAYAADAPPSQVHLTFGRDAATQMNVSWMTPAAIDAPFVELAGHRFSARTVQYEGYPGFFHHAPLTGLTGDSRYAYEVGHAGKLTGTASTFRTGPKPGTPFTFTAFGDQGTNGVGIGQPPNQPGANTELAASMAPSFHMIVGDLAYANGDQSIWDDWFTMIEPMARTTPWMPLIGNHEIESQLTGDAGDSWGKLGYDPYLSRFILPGNGHADLKNCFYGFRYGSVHYLAVDNNDVNEEITANIGYTKGRQRKFVEAELAAARDDPAVDFIVVGMHQCAFSSSTKHGSDPGVQKAWFELFRKYSVDLVLQGHDHTYERTHAMVSDEVVSEGPVYNSDVGTVYIVCGNGGAVQEPLMPAQPAWSAFRQDFKVGTLKIDVQPQAANGKTRMVLSEHWALDGSAIEEGIVLERSAAASPPTAAAAGSGEEERARGDKALAPTGTLPATGGPAGTALVGVAALAGGLALRTLSREERRQELADSR